jgi:UDPglucose 6-dehydrogenase
VRETPAATVIRELLRRGAIVQAHDPVAIPAFQRMYPQLNIVYTEEVSHLFADSDAVVLVTDWAMYNQLDWAKLARLMRSKLVIDGRNFLNKDMLLLAGIYYVGVGRTEDVLAVEPQMLRIDGHISQTEGDWYAASTDASS